MILSIIQLEFVMKLQITERGKLIEIGVYHVAVNF